MHRKTPEMFPFQVFSVHLANFLGGDKRDRTADLLNAIQALSQVIRLRTPGILKVRVQLAAWKWKQS